MEVTFYGYPKCGTCRKAEKWLKEQNIEVHYQNVAEEPPTEEQLADLHKKSGLPLKKFFNTSGRVYRDLGLKDQLASASDDEMLKWLASDGMLVKRPIVTDGKQVTVGFREEEFEEIWSN